MNISKILLKKPRKILTLGSIFVAGMGLSFLVIYFISRNYGVSDVGIYALSIKIIFLMSAVSMKGIDISLLKYSAIYNSDNKNKHRALIILCFKKILPLGLLISIFLFILSDFISLKVFKNINYSIPLKFCAIALPFFIINNIISNFLKGIMMPYSSEIIRSVADKFFTFLILIIGIWSYNLTNPVFAYTIALILSSIIGLLFIYPKIKLSKSENKKIEENKVLEGHRSIYFSSLITIINSQYIFYLTEILLNSTFVGLLQIIFKISTLCLIPLFISNILIAPYISNFFHANKSDDLNKLLSFNSLIICSLALLIVFFTLIFSNEFLRFFSEDAQIYSKILPIVLFGAFVNVFMGPSTLFMQMTGHTTQLRNNVIFTFLLNLPLSVYLINMYEFTGAVISLSLSISLIHIVNALTVYNKTNYKTFLSFYGKKTR